VQNIPPEVPELDIPKPDRPLSPYPASYSVTQISGPLENKDKQDQIVDEVETPQPNSKDINRESISELSTISSNIISQTTSFQKISPHEVIQSKSL
jgi:hypothetical protein